MKRLLLLMLILAMPFAYAEWFYDSETVDVRVNIMASADIAMESPKSYIESAAINMTFFPKETETQELLSFRTNPYAEQANGVLKFTWQNPGDVIDFDISADVRTRNTIKQVNNKIDFPIIDLPDDIKAYTKPTI